MRLLTSLLLLGCILCGFSASPAAAFWDVPPQDDHVFAYLQEQGILTGFSDGSMRPNASISRVEALTALLRSRERFAPSIVWLKENLPAIPLFPDIDQQSWYAPYVEVAFLKGIVTGYPDGFFRPGNTITTEEAIAMLMRIYREDSQMPPYLATPDLPNQPDMWFTDDLNKAIDRNFVQSGSRFSLGKPITRAGFFSLLQRAHEATETHAYAYVEKQIVALQPPIAVTPEYTVDSASLAFASVKPFAITIPKLNIYDLSILHPENPFDPQGILAPLKEGVGHLFSYPGSEGKMMIYGHSSGYAWDVSEYTKIFRQVNKMQPGDRAYITYNEALYVYEMTQQSIVDANDTSLFDDDGTEEAILYTCWPPDSTKQRLAVHLRPVEIVAIGSMGPHVE